MVGCKTVSLRVGKVEVRSGAGRGMSPRPMVKRVGPRERRW